jgi:hypothetical protein
LYFGLDVVSLYRATNEHGTSPLENTGEVLEMYIMSNDRTLASRQDISRPKYNDHISLISDCNTFRYTPHKKKVSRGYLCM